MNRRAAFLLCLLGCAPGGWKRGGTMEAVSRVEYQPAGEPAESYNDPPVTPPPDEAAVTQLVRLVAETAEANGRAAPAPDGRLCAVATEVASLSGDGPPPYAAVEFALAQHGIIEPSPHLLVVRAEGDDVTGVARELAGRLPAIVKTGRFNRVGAGQWRGQDGLTTFVLALQESFVTTDPIPRRAAPGGTVTVRGKLLHPFDDPHVYVTGADGKVARPALTREGKGAFRAAVACPSRPGRLQVEITGSDRSGSSVLANFPVWCGEVPPRSMTVVVSSPDAGAVTDDAAAERRIFELLNQARRTARLPELEWDERAAQVARAHSREMRDLGYVSHVSPNTGSAADRVQRAGISTPLILENLARAYSPAEAHEGLMNSPGHRANLLSAEATHVGVGLVLGREVAGRPELYVTQVFLRIPPPVDRATAREEIRRAIDERRRGAGRNTLTPDPELDAIAQELAMSLATGSPAKEEAVARADRRLDPLATRLRSVVTVMVMVGEPSEAAGEVTLEPGVRWLGVGVGQKPGEGGAIHVVLLLGKGS